jgi:anti-sigma factor RsiW
MNGERHRTGSLAFMTCPDFEDLSRFVDGEVETAHAESIASHVSGCEECDGLIARMREDVPAGGTRARENERPCGRAEDVLLYAIGQASMRERSDLESHLQACDRCVRELVHLRRRFALSDEADRPVPATVQAAGRRALVAALGDLAAEAGAATHTGRGLWAGLRERVERLLDLRVLVPVSVAAGALFMVGLQELWVRPALDGERFREVEVQQMLRVTAPEAVVRVRPHSGAAPNTTLQRGALVQVAGEQRGWILVLLPDGGSGWVDRRAFE